MNFMPGFTGMALLHYRGRVGRVDNAVKKRKRQSAQVNLFQLFCRGAVEEKQLGSLSSGKNRIPGSAAATRSHTLNGSTPLGLAVEST